MLKTMAGCSCSLQAPPLIEKQKTGSITLVPNKIAQFLAAIIAVLFTANLASLAHAYKFGGSGIDLFNFDNEASLPSYYSSVSLLFSSVLLAFIATSAKYRGRQYHRYWQSLAIIFAYLSIDEALSIHEKLGHVGIGLDGFKSIHYVWVIPYGLVTISLAICYIHLLVSLSRRIRFLIIAAGFIYVAGAIGCEIVGGYYAYLNGDDNIIFMLITTAEELLEMIGIAIFIYALTLHIAASPHNLLAIVMPTNLTHTKTLNTPRGIPKKHKK